MTKQQSIEYLVATPSNYTCTHLADHLELIILKAKWLPAKNSIKKGGRNKGHVHLDMLEWNADTLLVIWLG